MRFPFHVVPPAGFLQSAPPPFFVFEWRGHVIFRRIRVELPPPFFMIGLLALTECAMELHGASPTLSSDGRPMAICIFFPFPFLFFEPTGCPLFPKPPPPPTHFGPCRHRAPGLLSLPLGDAPLNLWFAGPRFLLSNSGIRCPIFPCSNRCRSLTLRPRVRPLAKHFLISF